MRVCFCVEAPHCQLTTLLQVIETIRRHMRECLGSAARLSLVGDYRPEHLFALRQSLKSYRHYQEQIQEVDFEVKQMMLLLPSKVAEGKKPPKGDKLRKIPWRNEPPQLVTIYAGRLAWI